MRDRLDCIRRLVAENGMVFVQIDDNEQAYLRVLLDEIFGRSNFLAQIVWQKKYAVKSDSEFFSESHEYILVYAKDRKKVQFNRLKRTAEQDSRYENPDNDPRGPWASGPLQRNEARDYAIFAIVGPSGKEHWPPQGTSWRFTKEKVAELIKDNRIWFGKTGNNVPRLKRFLSEVSDSVPPTTWWDYKDSGHNDEARRESRSLVEDGTTIFATPKPERLMQRIIEIGSNPGDIVLDSFLGSGTTAAVAHKMGRRWIGIELGEHCETHCLPRLKKVVDGADPGGVTDAVGWRGGGGFRYCRLAPSLLTQDKWGQWVISEKFNAPMLAEAVCKLEGFTYAPSDTLYWQHGHSTERDFLYVTTANLNHDQLQQLSDEVGPDRSLLVVCSAFRGRKEGYPNLTVKKIPKAVLTRCEWGKDDYSLKVENLPQAPPKIGQMDLFAEGGAA
jgi:adenine-specific DNA-methyltransferase